MKRLLCFGDSNTYGYRPDDARYDYATRWTGRLAGLLGPEWQVIEAGLNGRCAGHYDDIWPELNGADIIGNYAEKCAPLDAAIIMLGSNDALYALPNTIVSDMRRLLEYLLAKMPQPGRQVILLAPPVSAAPRLGLRQPGQLAAGYAQLAAELGITFADTAGWQLPLAEDAVIWRQRGMRCWRKNCMRC